MSAMWRKSRLGHFIQRAAGNIERLGNLKDFVPLDVSRVLRLGGGIDHVGARLEEFFPWFSVTDLASVGRDASNVGHIPFEKGSFDCVYALINDCEPGEASLLFREAYRVLGEGGVLVAGMPWTDREQAARARTDLENAGFRNLFASALSGSGGQWVRPARAGRALCVRAWKASGENAARTRAIRAMDWVYRRLGPEKPNTSQDVIKIIADGYGYCIAYSLALGTILRREGYDVTWITMKATDHERGSGTNRTDTHEVIEVVIDGRRAVLDPMANTYFQASLRELLSQPDLADRFANRDERCRSRGYDLYNTSYWYSRVSVYSRRRNTRWPSIIWKRNRHRTAT